MTRSTPDAEERGLDVLRSPVRRRIVDLLANLPEDPTAPGVLEGRTATELAETLGMHVTTARFHLDQLEASRLVESQSRRGGVGRPRKVYRSPRRPLSAHPSAEGALAAMTQLLTEAWHQSDHGEPVTPEEAGRRWALRHAVTSQVGQQPQASSPGAFLGKIGMTVDMLEGWGYRPEIRTAEGGRTAELTLVDCPFLPMAQEHPDVVCGVHRGLLRGTLEAIGETDTAVGLEPFVGPTTCRATVSTRADLSSRVAPADARRGGGPARPDATE